MDREKSDSTSVPSAIAHTADYLLKTIIPHSPIVLFVLDARGVFVRSEGKELEALNLKPGEIVGRSVFDVYKDFPNVLDSVRTALSGKAFTEEVKVGDLYFKVRYEPLTGRDNTVIGVVGLAINISEHKQVEQELRNAVASLHEEKAKTEAIIAAMGDGISIQDRDFKILYQNKAHRDMTGDHIGEYCYEAYDRGGRVCEGCPVALSYQDRAVHTIEKSNVVDGKTVHVEITASPLLDANGDIIAGIEIVRNVTGRKYMELELRESEERYRLFTQDFLGIAHQLDTTTFKPVFMHGAVEEITGYSPDDFLTEKMTWPRLVVQEDVSRFSAEGKKLSEVPGYVANTEYRIRRKDGKVRWVNDICRSTYSHLRKKNLVQGVVYDVTARRRAEEALRESEQLFRTIFDYASTGIALTDEQGYVLAANEADCRFLGYDRKEIIGMHFSEFTQPEDLAIDSELYQELVDGRRDSYTIDKRYIRKDKQVVWGRLSVSLVKGADSRIRYAVVICSDITDQKRAEEDLRKSEAELRAVFNAIPDMMFRIQRDGTFLDFKAAKQFDPLLPPSEFIGKKLQDVMPVAIAQKTMYYLEKIFQTGLVEAYDYELADNGNARYYEARFAPINSDEALAIIRDITEHRALEEQLRHAQKMEAIGTLTGGVAHEFNNILTSVIGFSELLQRGMERTNPLTGYVEKILKSAERAARLTQGLLAYSRKQVSFMEPVDLNGMLLNIQEFLMSLVGERIRLVIQTTEEVITARVDKAQVEQILMNLTTNAIDAMPDGGTLTITARRVGYDDIHASHRATMDYGPYALITIEDTGTGIANEIRSKIFEPFFTTKDIGKGTGLGLSMVYGLMKKHNGCIFFDSTPDKGTVFYLYFPLIAPESAVRQPTPRISQSSGTGTVLLAEDDPVVREIVAHVLNRSGFTVFEAVDGSDALDQYAVHKDAIDLLLFDVAMPRKSGKEAYDEIKKTRPDIKVIFISGYLPDDIRTKTITEEGFTLISKPLKSDELLEKIRDVLAAR